MKLGWAVKATPENARWDLALDDNLPAIVLPGASRLDPSLKTCCSRLPRGMHHEGNRHMMTEENWPLIGPMGLSGAVVIAALSGLGAMAAYAGGAWCAAIDQSVAQVDFVKRFGNKIYDLDAT